MSQYLIEQFQSFIYVTFLRSSHSVIFKLFDVLIVERCLGGRGRGAMVGIEDPLAEREVGVENTVQHIAVILRRHGH